MKTSLWRHIAMHEQLLQKCLVPILSLIGPDSFETINFLGKAVREEKP